MHKNVMEEREKKTKTTNKNAHGSVNYDSTGLDVMTRRHQ